MHILIFELKEVCYNSYIYFAESLGNELSKLGHDVEYFRLSEKPFDNLEKYIDKSFDYMIDFNSDLPRALMDDDSFFIDHINGQFYDIILDHPLYHHDSLKNKLENFNVICLDENHKNYIEKYYPHIKNVGVCHLTGETAVSLKNDNLWNDWSDRPYDLCFTGSYTAPEKMELAISKAPDIIKDTVPDIIDILLANPDETIESVVEMLSKDENHDYINLDFPLHTQTYYLADAYVRCINRKNIIQLIDNEVPNFHVFGGLWDELNFKNAIVHPEVPFSYSFAVQSHSKIALNVMPNFKHGAHDRVFSAQLNGAITLTDPSISLVNEFTNNENILFYSLKDINSIPEIIINTLNKSEKAIKIAQNGYSIANENHTWANVAKRILDIMN